MDEVRYQVFVSSTFRDLKEEREKALQAILEIRAFPAGMELFPSADDEQFEFIKREIDSSDYYIVIIAGRYGSIPTNDVVSFTEKEYDYAVSRGKPVLAFLHHDTQQLIGEKLESTDEGRTRLAAFRQKASGNRLVSHYQNQDDLKAKVLASLVSQFNLKPMRGWVRNGQTAREVLEQVNSLQQRVIELESENTALRRLSDSATEILAKNDDSQSWDLDLNTFTFENRWPSKRTLTLQCTWNELLQAVFPGGASSSILPDVNRGLARLVLERIEVLPEDAIFRETAARYFDIRFSPFSFPELTVVTNLRAAVSRQLTGLGLMKETIETVYVPAQYGAAPTPTTMKVWRLTERGEQHLALIEGSYRTAPSAR